MSVLESLSTRKIVSWHHQKPVVPCILCGPLFVIDVNGICVQTTGLWQLKHACQQSWGKTCVEKMIVFLYLNMVTIFIIKLWLNFFDLHFEILSLTGRVSLLSNKVLKIIDIYVEAVFLIAFSFFFSVSGGMLNR